jgi:hypothetical protein
MTESTGQAGAAASEDPAEGSLAAGEEADPAEAGEAVPVEEGGGVPGGGSSSTDPAEG